MKPLVSVLIVAYNSFEFIGEAIESVLASTYDNLEIIISDDNSTDNTWDIVSSYKDLRIRAFRNLKNVGEYSNRNFCIEQARGKYLVFIDGDDTIYKNGLENAVNQMELYENKVAFGIARPEQENYARPYLIDSHDAYYMHYFKSSLFNLSLSRNIFNTKILKDEGGLPENFISGDSAIRLKLAAKYNILVIDDHLGRWRKREGQASEKLDSSRKGVLEPYRINLQYIEDKFCPLNEFERKSAKKIIRKKLIMHSLLSLKRRRLKLGLSLISQAVFSM